MICSVSGSQQTALSASCGHETVCGWQVESTPKDKAAEVEAAAAAAREAQARAQQENQRRKEKAAERKHKANQKRKAREAELKAQEAAAKAEVNMLCSCFAELCCWCGGCCMLAHSTGLAVSYQQDVATGT